MGTSSGDLPGLKPKTAGKRHAASIPKKQQGKLRIQQVAVALLVGGGLACLVSILLLMRSLDSTSAPSDEISDELAALEAGSHKSSVSIRALHLLHQAQIRANQASQFEVGAKQNSPKLYDFLLD
jgi:hypothetical protein